ncbi:MAG: microcin C ABC transporter permease YejB [Alphaproteobacteria bacterium]|nr:microcin C ABC transporter permease YejB [Alphaproteobacteria bacterium]MCW5740313.1 microcin C ABC transporter permease YejB [Alphaproteobacteria bacterium]
MARYVLRRLLLMIPTLFGIMTVNFLIMQLAPGGPVERFLSELTGGASDLESRLSDGLSDSTASPDATSIYRGAERLPPELLEEIERMLGFDKPLHERFVDTMVRLATFDFGKSFFRDARVVDLVLERIPVSVSLGLWSTLLIYLVSIPLGMRMAARRGGAFDTGAQILTLVTSAIPAFLIAVLLIVFFAGGRFLDWFPLRGLVSDDWSSLSWPARIADYLWHITLPTLAMAIGGFGPLVLMTRNAFLDELGKTYVMAARARGASPRVALWKHVFRNAMLIVMTGLPGALIGMLFASGLLIEVIFSLDGLGLLGFEASLGRDYPLMFATIYTLTLLGLLVNLAGDVVSVLIDPRIDFAAGQR